MELLVQSINNPLLGSGLQGVSGVEFFGRLLRALISLGLVIGAIIFFFVLLMGAIQWMTSGGDKAQTEAARSKLTNAFIGIVILFSIFAIIRLVETFFGTNIMWLRLGPLEIGGGNSENGGNGGCFLAGTKIKMADGTYLEIQDIKSGDIVYSYNLESGALVEDRVSELLVHTDYPGGYLVINDKLKITGNHNLWVINRLSWQRADTLNVGDILLNPDGEEVLITSIEKVDGKNTVYNLHLNGKNHNYFTENVLVHNALKM